MMDLQDFYREDGIELIRLRAQLGDAFPKHTHDEYVISANLAGIEHVWLDRQRFTVLPGAVTAYNPGAMQASDYTCEDARSDFISVYVSPHRVAAFVAENAIECGGKLPEIETALIHNNALFKVLLRMNTAVRSGYLDQVKLLIEEFLGGVLAFGTPSQARPARDVPAGKLANAMEFMAENMHRPISLEELCAAANLSKYHLIRVFQSAVGVSPIQYHMQLRLKEGRRRLRQGALLHNVVFDLGFYDQSHFTNAFRKVVGMPPQRYAHGAHGSYTDGARSNKVL